MFCFNVNVSVSVAVVDSVCFRIDIRMFIPGFPVHGIVSVSIWSFQSNLRS